MGAGGLEGELSIPYPCYSESGDPPSLKVLRILFVEIPLPVFEVFYEQQLSVFGRFAIIWSI